MALFYFSLIKYLKHKGFMITKILNCSDSEIEQIAQIESQLFTDSWDFQALKDLFSQDCNYVFVVQQDKTIVGYCICQMMFDTAEILRIAVDKNHQRQGFAWQLLSKVTDFLNQHRVEKLLLEVREDNVLAINFYQKFGFNQIHIRKGYYANQDGTTTNALILQKDL